MPNEAYTTGFFMRNGIDSTGEWHMSKVEVTCECSWHPGTINIRIDEDNNVFIEDVTNDVMLKHITFTEFLTTIYHP